MRRWLSLDRLANIAIVAMGIVAVISTMRYFHARTVAHPDVLVPAGSRVALQHVNWAGNKLTVVFALSTECHFCSGNAALYRSIVDSLRATHNGVTVALLPQQVVLSRQYLSALNVTPDQVVQNSIAAVGARATPTIIAVDSQGRVLKSWVGRLSENDAAAVRREIVSLGQKSHPCSTCGTS